jgi:hypothetical protein
MGTTNADAGTRIDEIPNGFYRIRSRVRHAGLCYATKWGAP